MRIWDSFFALVVLFTCIWTPLAIIFKNNFHFGGVDINWVVLDIFINGFWALAFFININRVDFVRKIVTFEDTAKAYLRSPHMIPDAVCLIGSIIAIALDEPITAKVIELIRIIHFNDALFPVNLCIQNFTNSG